MKLKIEGTYKHRLRINLWLFTIAGRWQTDRFSNTLNVVVFDKAVHFALKNVPVSLDVSIKGLTASVELQVIGETVYKDDFLIVGVDRPVPFKVVPWKGVEVSGVATLVQD